ncbi:pyridoxal-phosphate dependent protein [Dictyocaulus viviparus]|uniref:Pyridoxal-phosphate dependent protein n=1 Tax=Dictyocaulus viviparus TaxID=29172 RepID=A0A0D8XZQ5_DICVI|nr:pyridoxal-phosphate dependent protein [Dictyocaulus viviparus]
MLVALLFLISLSITQADVPTLVKLHKAAYSRTISDSENKWRSDAINKLWSERKSMGHTPLVKFQMKGFPNIDIFFKNETASKTRTLKHRFAWALVLWSIIEGKVNSNSTVYDSTSGNTGASEAYMCTLVGLPYIAVVAKDLENEKIHQITSNGGKIMKVDVSLRNYHAQEEAKRNNGFFINQFGNAAEAEELHESGDSLYESSNIYHEIIKELNKDKSQKKKYPDYFVHSSGTGGTITSVGRYVKRYNMPTVVVLSDSEYSLFYDYVLSNKFTNESGTKYWVKPGVAGIGYGYNVKPVIYGETTSLQRHVIDEVMKMPDIASAAAMHVLRERGIGGGASTGLNFLVSLHKAYQQKNNKHINGRLTIVTLICDPGEFYESTYFNSTWIENVFAKRGGTKALSCWKKVINKSIETGSDFLEEGLAGC